MRTKRRKNQGVVASYLGGQAVPYALKAADKATRTIMRTKNRSKKKRNSVSAAEKVYTGFHGHPPERDTIIDTEMHEHSVLPAIGELCWIVIRYEDADGEECDVRLEDFDGAFLCMNEQRDKRPQLYIEGGDQAVDLKAFEISAPLHENETLGRLVCVAYYTIKDHLGEDGGEAEYVHVIEAPLDEEEFEEWDLPEMDLDWDEVQEETADSRGPDVIYDTRNKLLLLSGGSYTLPDEGIDH